MKEYIHNIITDKVIENELSTEQSKSLSKVGDYVVKSFKEAQAKETAKVAILDRIGLTADELKTILG